MMLFTDGNYWHANILKFFLEKYVGNYFLNETKRSLAFLVIASTLLSTAYCFVLS